MLYGRDKISKSFAAAKRFITGPIEKTPRGQSSCILPLYLWYQSHDASTAINVAMGKGLICPHDLEKRPTVKPLLN